MQRGSSYKAAPFRMKGYSYPGKSPVRQTNYFTTSLFTGGKSEVSDKTKKQIQEEEKMYSDAYDQYLGEDYQTQENQERLKDDKTTDDVESGKQTEGRGINPELLLAATMPIGYVIGKGLTRLFGGRSKKEEIAKAGELQEAKVKKSIYKHSDYLRDEAKRRKENPTTELTTKGKKEIKVKTKKNPYGIN